MSKSSGGESFAEKGVVVSRDKTGGSSLRSAAALNSGVCLQQWF